MTDNQKMNRSKKQALPHLIACKNYKEASEKIGISVSQIYEWLKDPEFKSELERQRNALFDSAIDSLKAHSVRAAEVLAELLESENEVIRRGAANDILNHVLENKKKDHENRILALEEANR